MKNIPGAERKVARVLWAVDPFHESPREQLRGFEAVTKLFGKVPITVQPVSLISHRVDRTLRDYPVRARLNVETLCGEVKHPALGTPHLIQNGENHSPAHFAKEFLHYAVEEGAHLLVVTSHARKGIDRLLLGSFAESLTLQSPIPVLVVNPHSKAKSAARLKHVLFPTDFSALSFRAFQRTVALAAETGLAIMLFHKVKYLQPDLGPAFIYPAVDPESVQERKDSYRHEGKKWASYAEDRGVKVTFHLDTSSGRPLDEILRAAKKLGSSSMIAMASQVGAAEALLIGSLTRQVLRQAECPIMVIHPDHESMMKELIESLKLAGYHYTARPAYF